MTTSTLLPRADKKTFQQHMEHNFWNFNYLNRNLKSILNMSRSPEHLCLAYFDADGFLLELYGSPGCIKNLHTLGIIPGTVWTLDSIGYNAVTAGLKEKKAVSSAASQNDLSILKNYSIYYCPILLQRPSVDFICGSPPKDFGGIAAIVPLAYQDPHYLFLTASIAHDTVMTLHFNQHAVKLYERVGSGLLIVDSSMHKGKPTITHVNKTLFQTLGIKPRDLFFHPLEELLEPEANRDFWKLVKNPQDTGDTPLQLTVEGKSIYCTISCMAFNQPFLQAVGIICYITTPQIESRKISRRMGNSAILSFPNIIGESSAMKSAIQRAALIAKTDSSVMILGESGVGKDVFAQAIHNASCRKNKPFIAVNCGALPRDLIASELFGYDSGAFTGAKRTGNIGKFELADGGTIFLDEIGDLPLDLQASLLRVVEQKQLMRLGSSRLIDIDVKIISATNANIPHMIEQKLFRQDLFFRLSTLRLFLPPLRDRGTDILLLAEHFIRTISQKISRSGSMTLSPEASRLLMRLPWPGNVRELQNVMECIVQLYPDPVILPQHILENVILNTAGTNLPPAVPGPSGNAYLPPAVPGSSGNAYDRPAPPPARRKTITKEDILHALDACGGNRSRAAEYLGISRKTLYRKIEQFGLNK